MRKATGLLVLAIAGTAHADPSAAATLRTQGEALAKRGEYAQAIDAFKAADREDPQAQHACMIGLTYLRRNLIGQADLFFQRCRTRARTNDKLPAWVDSAEKQLRDTLAKSATAFEMTVTPTGAAATVKVSSFAPDETFDPQRFHLPAGTYTITVTAPGFPDSVKQVTAAGTGDQQVLDFVLSAGPIETDIKPPPPVVEPPPAEPLPVVPPQTTSDPMPAEPMPPLSDERERSANRAALPLMISGGIILAGGAAMHYFTWKYGKDELAGKPYSDDVSKRFDTLRISTITLYGAAAIIGGIGVYLHLRSPSSSTHVSAAPLEGGGMLTLGWKR